MNRRQRRAAASRGEHVATVESMRREALAYGEVCAKDAAMAVPVSATADIDRWSIIVTADPRNLGNDSMGVDSLLESSRMAPVFRAMMKLRAPGKVLWVLSMIPSQPDRMMLQADAEALGKLVRAFGAPSEPITPIGDCTVPIYWVWAEDKPS